VCASTVQATVEKPVSNTLFWLLLAPPVLPGGAVLYGQKCSLPRGDGTCLPCEHPKVQSIKRTRLLRSVPRRNYHLVHIGGNLHGIGQKRIMHFCHPCLDACCGMCTMGRVRDTQAKGNQMKIKVGLSGNIGNLKPMWIIRETGKPVKDASK